MENEFEVIELDISDEDKIALVKMFVAKRLSKSAQYTFEEECKQVSVDEALFLAVINEMVLEALIEKIGEENLKIDAVDEII